MDYEGKSSIVESNRSYNIAKIIIGLIVLLTGIAEVISKVSYTFYWWEMAQSFEVQVFGGIFALFGLYLLISGWKEPQ